MEQLGANHGRRMAHYGAVDIGVRELYPRDLEQHCGGEHGHCAHALEHGTVSAQKFASNGLRVHSQKREEREVLCGKYGKFGEADTAS